MEDDSKITYGFDKTTAQHLKASVGGVDSESPDGNGRMSPCLYGKTKSGGIVVGTPGPCLIYDATGTITTRELTAEARVTNIPADTEVVLFSAYGRWLALRLC